MLPPDAFTAMEKISYFFKMCLKCMWVLKYDTVWYDGVLCFRQTACQLPKSRLLLFHCVSLLALLRLNLCLHSNDSRGYDFTWSSAWCCCRDTWKGIEVTFLLLGVCWPKTDNTVGNRLRRPTTSSVFTFRFFNHSFFFSPTKKIHLSQASIERTLIYGTPWINMSWLAKTILMTEK